MKCPLRFVKTHLLNVPVGTLHEGWHILRCSHRNGRNRAFRAGQRAGAAVGSRITGRREDREHCECRGDEPCSAEVVDPLGIHDFMFGYGSSALLDN